MICSSFTKTAALCLAPCCCTLPAFVVAVALRLIQWKCFQLHVLFPLAQKKVESLVYFTSHLKVPVGAFCKYLMSNPVLVLYCSVKFHICSLNHEHS